MFVGKSKSFVQKCILVSALLPLFSCSGGMDPLNNGVHSSSRELQIRMHDFPVNDVDIEKVVVKVMSIEAHHEELGWMTLSDKPVKYDLLELVDGADAIIFQEPMEVGVYTQIRLTLSENNEVFAKGKPYRLKVPSGEQTGIKLITPFEIKEGKMVQVSLDFDAEKSVFHTKGQGFKLKPVIKVEAIEEYDAVGIVNEKGGNVTSVDESLNIQFYPGALPEETIVTVEELDASSFDPPAENTEFVGSVYDLDAGDVTFERPVMLTFKYDPADSAHRSA
jgi:hypothetical protein